MNLALSLSLSLSLSKHKKKSQNWKGRGEEEVQLELRDDKKEYFSEREKKHRYQMLIEICASRIRFRTTRVFLQKHVFEVT